MNDKIQCLVFAMAFAILAAISAAINPTMLGSYIFPVLCSVGWFMRSAAYIIAEAIEKAAKK